MNPMRRTIFFLLSLVAASPLAAQLHEATPLEVLMERAHHAMMHPETVTQPLVAPIPEAATKLFNIDAHQFAFTVSPSPFVVDEGDVVTLKITSSDVLHGFFLENYAEGDFPLLNGQTQTVQFVANTPGRFTYFCTNPGCGSGHISMIGTLTVNAVVGPTITSTSPATGPTSGGTTITINGTNFASGATVTIGGRAATNVTVVNATTITAVTPLGPTSVLAGQPLDIVVTNADGQSVTKAQAFTYFVPPPSITSLTPSGATTSGGTTVTIKGAGFTTAVVTIVAFGGTAATNVTIVDAVTMTVTAPAHAAGTVDVTVQVGTQSTTNASAFTYSATPSRRRAVRP
jgi:hypothetical protein